MIKIDHIVNLINDFLKETAFYLVDAQINKENLITVVIDHLNENVSIDKCIELSKYIESSLDREKEDFQLDVYSAGLTTSFVDKRQFEKAINKEISVKLKKGGKPIEGELIYFDEKQIKLKPTVKITNKKKKVETVEELIFNKEDILETKYVIRFK